MKGLKYILIFLLIAGIIAICGFFGIKHIKHNQVSSQIEEYIPEEEISEEQLKQTMVNLYFYNNATGKLEKESRLVNAVELLQNPYSKLVQLLIDGPKSEKLKTLIPEGTQIYNAEIDGSCVTLDMSIELLNHTEDTDLKNKMVNSIVNTLTELTEVESIKIIIDGKPNDEFDVEYVKM